MEQMSISLPEARRANRIPWLGNGREWIRKTVTYPSSLSKWLHSLKQSLFFSRMYLVCYQAHGEEIFLPCSRHFGNAGIASPTEFWTLNLPFPKGGSVYSLSDIAAKTGDVPPQFYLSPKGCRGILRRAMERGKILPPKLKTALELQSMRTTERTAE